MENIKLATSCTFQRRGSLPLLQLWYRRTDAASDSRASDANRLLVDETMASWGESFSVGTCSQANGASLPFWTALDASWGDGCSTNVSLRSLPSLDEVTPLSFPEK